MGNKNIKAEFRDAFFRKVSDRCDFVDPETVRSVYIGLVKTIFDELKSKGRISLPEWGSYEVIRYSGRNSRNIKTGIVEWMEPKSVVKFRPSYKLKDYVKNNVPYVEKDKKTEV